MKRFLNSLSIEDACRKVSGLEIHINPAAKEVLCGVAIEYSREELRRKGTDLLTLVSYADLRTFCDLWLSTHQTVKTENALIGLTHAIQSNATENAKGEK